MLQPQQRKAEETAANIGHQRTPTAEDFPLPAKQLLVSPSVGRKDAAAVTPAKSSFTFSDIEEQMPGQAKSRPGSKQGSRPPSRPGSSHQSPIARVNGVSSPMDIPKRKASAELLKRQELGLRKVSTTSINDNAPRAEMPRNRSASSVLPFREVSHGAREKVHRDSVILAEVKTNIIIRDEFMFLKEFSSHLSSRYQKPLSSIFVTLDHSACLLFANSFDSAYILTITALPSQIVASANKRNAALIQSFMSSALGVLPDRGLVKFVGLGDDYFATGGTTVQGQAERLERVLSLSATSNSSGGSGQEEQQRKPPDFPLPDTPPVHAKPATLPQPPPKTGMHSRKKPPALSLLPKSQSMPGSKMPSPIAMDSPAALPQIPIPPRSKTPSIFDRKAEKMRGSGRRKSILALFGRGAAS